MTRLNKQSRLVRLMLEVDGLLVFFRTMAQQGSSLIKKVVVRLPNIAKQR